jgi:hypothetical protein
MHINPLQLWVISVILGRKVGVVERQVCSQTTSANTSMPAEVDTYVMFWQEIPEKLADVYRRNYKKLCTHSAVYKEQPKRDYNPCEGGACSLKWRATALDNEAKAFNVQTYTNSSYYL